MMWWYGLDLTGSGKDQKHASFEYDKEYFGSINNGKFLGS
jgi:hypothetical protein